MNVLNRVLVVLAVLAAMVVCVAVFVVPIPILQAVGAWLQDLTVFLEGVSLPLRLLAGVLFAVAWVVVCVLFLALELIPRRRKTARLQKIDGGEVEVDLRSVEEHVAYAVDQLPGVLRTRSRVSGRKGGVVVEVDVDTAGDVEVPARANRVLELVRQVVEERVGVRLAQPPKVHLRAQPAPAAVERRESK